MPQHARPARVPACTWSLRMGMVMRMGAGLVLVLCLLHARCAAGETASACSTRAVRDEMVVVLAPTPFYSFARCHAGEGFRTEAINATKHASTVTLL